MPIVKHNWIVEDVCDLAHIICEAFIVAKSGRPGPVLVDIPKDISSAACEYIGLTDTKNLDKIINGRAGRLLEKTRRKTFTEADIENAALFLKAAKRPMIFAGGGVVRGGASAELKKLAELLGAPVALSLMGLGAFPAEHPLCTGLIGKHGTIASGKAAKKTDLLIALGSRFSDRVSDSIERFTKGAKIIHIDIDPAEINKNLNSDVSIIGDIKIILGELIKKMPSKNSTEWGSEISEWKTEALMAQKVHPRKGALRSKGALHPHFVISETAKVLGDDAIVVTDVGQHQIWTAQIYPFKHQRKFLSSAGMGTMGFGVGACVGAKIANPKSPVVLFTGDGSFRMNCAEMATLVKYELPVLIIIFNNRTLGMLRQWQNIFYKSNYYETDLDKRGPDFIKLAAAYDVQGFCAADEKSFLEALGKSRKILAAGKPALIEAIINKNEKVTPMN
jgi:acetolactate synthase-1/2/3 large subunit